MQCNMIRFGVRHDSSVVLHQRKRQLCIPVGIETPSFTLPDLYNPLTLLSRISPDPQSEAAKPNAKPLSFAWPPDPPVYSPPKTHHRKPNHRTLFLQSSKIPISGTSTRVNLISLQNPIPQTCKPVSRISPRPHMIPRCPLAPRLLRKLSQGPRA